METGVTHTQQPFVCTIESLGFSGEGVCRHEGQVVFVPHALPGEKAEVQIIKRRKNFAFARNIKVLTPSPERVQPMCPHFFGCGGCAAQHMVYELQLRFKQQGIQDNLKRVANIDLPTNPVIGMAMPYHYRNKTTWKVGLVDGTATAGFYAPASHDLVKVDTCLIASIPSNSAKNAVVNWLNEGLLHGELHQDLPIYQFVTRTNQAGELVVILHLTSKNVPRADALIDVLKQAVPVLVCVCAVDDTNKVQALFGKPLLHESLLDVHFQLSPFSFFQVNHEVCEKMYTYALKQVIQSENNTLIDLYSGVGTISLIAARRCQTLIGIERNKQAVTDARQNASNNQITNVVFHAGDAEVILPTLVEQGLKADAVILDPPRKGAHADVLKAIAQAQPKRIVYISCHPASQARDAALLTGMGYEAISCQPFDMFCQTAEVENVMTFIKKK